MNHFVCLLLLLITQTVSGQKKAAVKQTACPPGTVYAIQSLQSDNYADLRFLIPMLANKQIVLLGESSHGIGDYYALKSRLVKFLHSECGFEVLSLESGIADIRLAYRQVDSLSAIHLRNNTVYGNFQCTEIMPLFHYIKEMAATPKPLLYTGFDSQNFSESLRLLKKILNECSENKGDSLIKNIGLYYKIPGMFWQQDRAPLYRLADTIRSSATYALEMFNAHIPKIQTRFGLSETDIQFMQRALQNHIDGASVNWNYEDPSAKRDSLMAGNLSWLMNKVYPGKKVIVWAHNGHIDRKSANGNPYTWMGHYISRQFGDASFHIGLFAKEGETFEWWTKTNKPFNNKQANDVEQVSAIHPITFTFLKNKKSCNWAGKQLFGYEVENGGRLGFVPAHRFDAIITLQKVKLPTYMKP